MLEKIGTDTDDPYWAAKTAPPPKRKHAAADGELLDDSISIVKMAASQKKKVSKLAMKLSPLRVRRMIEGVMISDATMVASQNTLISHGTNLSNKVEIKQIIDWFDKLAAQMEAFMKQQTSSSPQCSARAHIHESSLAT